MRKYGKTEKNRKSEGISFPVFKLLQVKSGCKKAESGEKRYAPFLLDDRRYADIKQRDTDMEGKIYSNDRSNCKQAGL
ncbi:MAG: hypothetical protein K2N46_05895 [Lachnospiraceae bacterium]|nr:hypothetical protein [Lachnospiraceae bacterium]